MQNPHRVMRRTEGESGEELENNKGALAAPRENCEVIPCESPRQAWGSAQAGLAFRP